MTDYFPKLIIQDNKCVCKIIPSSLFRSKIIFVLLKFHILFMKYDVFMIKYVDANSLFSSDVDNSLQFVLTF